MIERARNTIPQIIVYLKHNERVKGGKYDRKKINTTVCTLCNNKYRYDPEYLMHISKQINTTSHINWGGESKHTAY